MASQFGALLRQLRLRAGMTQEGLAERSDLGVRTIRGLETGERADPRVGTVRRLAEALDLDATERGELFAAAGHGERAPEPKPVSTVDIRLAEAAGQLAHAVRARWQREEEQRQIHDPFPLPVRWRTVDGDLIDSWANIRRARAGGRAAPLDLSGQLGDIVDVYRKVESGRLVVLGRAGSGKTILTLRFVLALLKDRAAADPVPVIFSLGSWQPTTTPLRDWLTEQLLRDHPGLSAPGPDGSTLAAALVATDRILPVLDGFDEIAGGLHRAALEALNGTTLPLLLTSRPEEYAAAVAGTDVLTAAAGVRLTDLTVTDLVDYLPRTTRKHDGTAWAPVLAELRDHPHSTASTNLTQVLTTPLMVGLARTIYSDTPDHDPAVLLDTTTFPTPESVEEHLLGNFVPTVYRHQPDDRRFDPERVEHWFGHLAHHLTRLGTHDLAWWHFGVSLHRPVRVLVVSLLVALGVAAADIVVEAAILHGITGPQVVFGVLLGVVAGLAFGLAHGLASRYLPVVLRPSRVRLGFRRGGHRRGHFGARFRIGAVGGAILGFLLGLMRESVRALLMGTGRGVVVGVADALVFAVVFAVAAGLVFGLMALGETPLDITSAGSPAELLRVNRTTVVVQVLLFGPGFAVAVTATSWLAVTLLNTLPPGYLFGLTFEWNPLFGLAFGLVGGIGGAVGFALALTAWGQWVVFARVWLPLTGRLPFAVHAFLDDAYRRGVLRRAGAVYQFRHARLQDHLANRYTTGR
ncbi:helix-turn-helix domain-containing protein [Actinophytocola sp. KF-1]